MARQAQLKDQVWRKTDVISSYILGVLKILINYFHLPKTPLHTYYTVLQKQYQPYPNNLNVHHDSHLILISIHTSIPFFLSIHLTFFPLSLLQFIFLPLLQFISPHPHIYVSIFIITSIAFKNLCHSIQPPTDFSCTYIPHRKKKSSNSSKHCQFAQERVL